MSEPPPPIVVEAASDPTLRRTLTAADLPVTGRFLARAGWANRVWVGDHLVVRLGDDRFRDAYRHEAEVTRLLSGSDVPHARHHAHGDGPDGPWAISERLPGRTLYAAWSTSDRPTRRAMIESLGGALRALHRVPVPADLLPPWLTDALAGGARPAFHPPVVGAALGLVEDARRRPGHDPRLLTEVAGWIRERLPLFAADRPVLVHGDLHGSNVMVDRGRVTGLIDFAEASAQPADVELDIILRWCAMARDYPPEPGSRGLDKTPLTELPGWLRAAYPELFEHDELRERLRFYDLHRELALLAHHPQPAERRAAQGRITRLLAGHHHVDGLAW